MHGIIDKQTGALLRHGAVLDQLVFDDATEEAVLLDDALFDGDHDWDPVTRTVVPNLVWIETRLHAEIDRQAGEFRGRFITTVPGQEMTYLRKEEEARAHVAGTNAEPLMLTAEAAATGVTVADLAAAVIQKADEWAGLGAAIEAARIGAKAAVTAAATREAKIAAAVVDWEGLLS